MTVLTLDLGLDERGATLGARLISERAERGGRGRLTLDDVVVGVWEGLAAARPAPCPVCGGTMAPSRGAGSSRFPRAGGRCGDCGATLR
jgi:hypothetical protein